MSPAAKGWAKLLLKNYRAWDFIVKWFFRVIHGSPRSMLSKNVIVTSNITSFKCKNLPAPQGMTSTGRVRTKILLSATIWPWQLLRMLYKMSNEKKMFSKADSERAQKCVRKIESVQAQKSIRKIANFAGLKFRENGLSQEDLLQYF